MSYTRNIILHSHIFKNAGTTFDHCLKRNFQDKFMDHRDDKGIINGKLDFLKDFLIRNKEINAFSSHSIHFNAHNDDSFTFHQIYFVRHPIERIRSVYMFERKQPSETSLGAKMAKELDFSQYIEWRMREDVAATIRNCHTIFLSGEGPNADHIDKKFISALSNLNNVDLIGVVDRYDESMVVFEEHLKNHFGEIDLSYTRKNITDKSPNHSVSLKANSLLGELDSSIKKLVLAKNEFDRNLYDEANKKLDKAILKIEDFDKKLNLFNARNTIL